MHPYTEKPGDIVSRNLYPGGTLHSYTALNEGKPANGWSSKKYYPSAVLQEEENYSKGRLIEKIVYNENGVITGHKIWNNRLKQLVEKPAPSQLRKPNVVTGHASVTRLLQQLPSIAAFIRADYNKYSFLRSYEMVSAPGEGDAKWTMMGNQMSFTVYWNKEEISHQWHCHCATEELYREARKFLEKMNP